MIYHQDDCIKLLDEYDTVGINKIVDHHYSGNFWWTTGKYFLKLPEEISDKKINYKTNLILSFNSFSILT